MSAKALYLLRSLLFSRTTVNFVLAFDSEPYLTAGLAEKDDLLGKALKCCHYRF